MKFSIATKSDMQGALSSLGTNQSYEKKWKRLKTKNRVQVHITWCVLGTMNEGISMDKLKKLHHFLASIKSNFKSS